MRILVTRPQPDAGRTAARLQALGHLVLVQPLLEIVLTDPPADLPTPGAILITSRNAVRALARWPQLPAWSDVPVFAAGAASADAVADLGLANIHTGDGDAASLADLVLGTLPRSAGPLLYPAARDRAGALAGGLTARGYDVRVVEAYRAEPVVRLDPEVRAAFAAGTIEGVTVFSARTADALFAVAGREGLAAALALPTYFALSNNVAARLRAHGTADIRIAQNPDEDSLVALIPATR